MGRHRRKDLDGDAQPGKERSGAEEHGWGQAGAGEAARWEAPGIRKDPKPPGTCPKIAEWNGEKKKKGKNPTLTVAFRVYPKSPGGEAGRLRLTAVPGGGEFRGNTWDFPKRPLRAGMDKRIHHLSFRAHGFFFFFVFYRRTAGQ